MTSNISFWVLQCLAMIVTSWLIPGLRVSSIFGPALAVAALAFINAHVWDAALFFQLPNSFTLHACLLLCANAFIFWVVVKIVPGISVSGVFSSIAAPVVFSACSLLISGRAKDVDWTHLASEAIKGIEQTKAYIEKSGDSRPDREGQSSEETAPKESGETMSHF